MGPNEIVSLFHGDFQTGLLCVPDVAAMAGVVDSTCLVVSRRANGSKSENLEVAADLRAVAGLVAGMTAGMALGAIGGAAVDMADLTGMSTGLESCGDMTGPPLRSISNVKSDCLG
jgi:hypothetical protein